MKGSIASGWHEIWPLHGRKGKMKKNFIKEMAVLLVFALSARPEPAYAGWQQDGPLWKYERDGAWLENTWVYDANGWYYLGHSGILESGWKQDKGRWYFLNPLADGAFGKMMTGWQWIDGRCYFLAEKSEDGHPLGAMYAGGRTPDGYWVDESGAWADEKGEVVEIPGKGIISSGKTAYGGRETVSLGGGSGGSGSGGRSSKRGGGSSGNGGKKSSTGDGQGSENSNADRTDLGEGGMSQGNDSAIGQELPKPVPDPSNVWMVDWYVHFVDEETHQILLGESRQGSIRDGESLAVNFRERLVDSENRIWESVQEPPLTWEVYGPGDQIYYVEYRYVGQMPETEGKDQEERKQLRDWLETAKIQDSLVTGEDASQVPDRRILVSGQGEVEERLLSIAGQMETGKEYEIYLIGKNLEPDGMILKKTFGEEIVYSRLVADSFCIGEDTYTVVRFAVKREEEREPEDKEVSWEKLHWDLEDVLTAELGGEQYCFRCIDQNYSDRAGNHCQGALFLCDFVIPADFGSSYSYGQLEDGSYGYEFCPGPIAVFGEGNDYKYSAIRAWLQEAEENFAQAKTVDIGISMAYTGSTGEGMYGQFNDSDLKGSPIGSQRLTGKLFILSVEEALKYRNYLWDVEECGPFSKGYWLQNPMGTAHGYDTGFVYTVDLANGKISPVAISPEEGAKCAVGVRPAFVMPQEALEELYREEEDYEAEVL